MQLTGLAERVFQRSWGSLVGAFKPPKKDSSISRKYKMLRSGSFLASIHRASCTQGPRSCGREGVANTVHLHFWKDQAALFQQRIGLKSADDNTYCQHMLCGVNLSSLSCAEEHRREQLRCTEAPPKLQLRFENRCCRNT